MPDEVRHFDAKIYRFYEYRQSMLKEALALIKTSEKVNVTDTFSYCPDDLWQSTSGL